MGKGGPNPAIDKGKNSSLLYNEFIVYDEKQVKMRYVLQVKFHHSRNSFW